MKSKLIAILYVMFLSVQVASAQKPFIDWANLRNPVLSYPNWSIKDSATAYRNGVFYVFFSAFYDDHGRVRSHVAEVSTTGTSICFMRAETKRPLTCAEDGTSWRWRGQKTWCIGFRQVAGTDSG